MMPANLDDLVELLQAGYPLPVQETLPILREQQKVAAALRGEDIPALLADARRWRDARESMHLRALPEVSDPVLISAHALARYREHYPDAELDDARADLAASIEIPPETAVCLIGRTGSTPHPGKYYLSRDRRGLWATTDQRRIRTYLRLGQSQREFARQHWP